MHNCQLNNFRRYTSLHCLNRYGVSKKIQWLNRQLCTHTQSTPQRTLTCRLTTQPKHAAPDSPESLTCWLSALVLCTQMPLIITRCEPSWLKLWDTSRTVRRHCSREFLALWALQHHHTYSAWGDIVRKSISQANYQRHGLERVSFRHE
jgi:hypothetical protein